VRSIYPTDAPLPINETGYRSHFIAASAVASWRPGRIRGRMA
jgi:hypothetical protein